MKAKQIQLKYNMKTEAALKTSEEGIHNLHLIIEHGEHYFI